ncbi:retrovirus-related Pol polyprotein from transposon opus [Trichonephila clavipes]|nr:retrovirus-related Pol polyprotein from transposon opus [Trichonephila clavipes]
MKFTTERRVIHQVKIDPKISAPKIAASTSNTLGRSVSAETRAVKKHQITSKEQLKSVLQEQWLNIAPETTRHLVEAMPRRLEAVISAKEVGKPIDENSACVEVGTTHKHLRRGDNSNNFKNYFSSNDITCEEVKSVESTFLLDTSYVRATREPEKKKGETYIQFAARLTANFQYYCSLRKVNSFESLCDLIISDKLFETLNKETATHIGIREAEDWFRPIDLAKECDIYISSRSGSHKEIPITYGYTQNPFKNRSQNFKPKIKENYPQYLERENKNCYICGDSSHCARDCEKRFKSKESNDHIHNRINVNTLKIESEKQNSDECANLQYVNIFVENQPVTALIDSGCQIPVLNSSLIRVQTPSEEIITLSSCFGEQRMVEVKPINFLLINTLLA